jgi:hypothetical protein
MTRWFHAVLFALLVCLLLIADVARASVGGPSSVELLGWDPVDRKIYVAVHFDDPEAWEHPLVGFWLVDGDDPGTLVMDHAFEEAAMAAPGPDATLVRVDELRQRLEPLTPVDPVGLELRERLLAVDRCDGPVDPGLLAPCREVMVQLHWLGQVRELRLTTWGMSDLVGAWEVPETGHRVVLYSHLGHTFEIGYQQELAVLFEPSGQPGPHDAPDRSPLSPEDEVARWDVTNIRHY